MRAALLVACAAVLLLAVLWDGPEPRRPPGVLVPYEPDQDPTPLRQWPFKDSQVTALASFRVRARVLLTGHYWWGNQAAVSPVDLTLGWRLMSNQEVLDGLHLYRMRRAYAWAPRNGRLPAGGTEIGAHSANMHMVPSTAELAGRLRAINRGDLVDIRGYLVEIKFPNGGTWRSSVTRTDSGNGACELVWVEELTKYTVSQARSRISRNRSLTVAAPIRAARVSKRFPDTLVDF
ncbi:MAG: hypothetical protein NTW28_32975 [Candidatus Solibacter sp.]|nr:hypothetical protein [Candidatus Solibacter sp.]